MNKTIDLGGGFVIKTGQNIKLDFGSESASAQIYNSQVNTQIPLLTLNSNLFYGTEKMGVFTHLFPASSPLIRVNSQYLNDPKVVMVEDMYSLKRDRAGILVFPKSDSVKFGVINTDAEINVKFFGVVYLSPLTVQQILIEDREGNALLKIYPENALTEDHQHLEAFLTLERNLRTSDSPKIACKCKVK